MPRQFAQASAPKVHRTHDVVLQRAQDLRVQALRGDGVRREVDGVDVADGHIRPRDARLIHAS